jgi:hypothetical protein
MGARLAGLQLERAAVRAGRARDIAQRFQRNAEIAVGRRVDRVDGYGLRQELDGAGMLAALVGDYAKQQQRVEVARLGGQDFS